MFFEAIHPKRLPTPKLETRLWNISLSSHLKERNNYQNYPSNFKSTVFTKACQHKMVSNPLQVPCRVLWTMISWIPLKILIESGGVSISRSQHMLSTIASNIFSVPCLGLNFHWMRPIFLDPLWLNLLHVVQNLYPKRKFGDRDKKYPNWLDWEVVLQEGVHHCHHQVRWKLPLHLSPGHSFFNCPKVPSEAWVQFTASILQQLHVPKKPV